MFEFDPETLYITPIFDERGAKQYVDWWLHQAYGTTTPALVS